MEHIKVVVRVYCKKILKLTKLNSRKEELEGMKIQKGKLSDMQVDSSNMGDEKQQGLTLKQVDSLLSASVASKEETKVTGNEAFSSLDMGQLSVSNEAPISNKSTRPIKIGFSQNSLLREQIAEMEEEKQRRAESMARLKQENMALLENEKREVKLSESVEDIEKAFRSREEALMNKINVLEMELAASKDDNNSLANCSNELSREIEELKSEMLKKNEQSLIEKMHWDNLVSTNDELMKSLQVYKDGEVRLTGELQSLKESKLAAVGEQSRIVHLLEEEQVLRKEAETLNSELAGTISELTTEKAGLTVNHRDLSIKKNRLKVKYDMMMERFQDQTKVLLKAQAQLRELISEDYEKRLHEKKRWKKLKFWK